MHFARPAPPRTTKATVRFGSSLSPLVTSLAAALTAALVAEPAFRPAGKQQPCCTSESPRLCRGLSYFAQQSAMARGCARAAPFEDPRVGMASRAQHPSVLDVGATSSR